MSKESGITETEDNRTTGNGDSRSGCSAKRHVAGVARRSVEEWWKGKMIEGGER